MVLCIPPASIGTVSAILRSRVFNSGRTGTAYGHLFLRIGWRDLGGFTHRSILFRIATANQYRQAHRNEKNKSFHGPGTPNLIFEFMASHQQADGPSIRTKTTSVADLFHDLAKKQKFPIYRTNH
jgi:hypothetical protein